ncbi:TrkA family potassium uptake protein [Carboxydochorda subterranea]|uniref:TrkA family potassium uptake protein n=1 Tax=Carboxydichorda subterranea TaxID=3109565 RepID=A0ABZ1C1G8_9FIRM|nr:TrkA family potassium uptake protein [Limnochorda sp. L945t]WRP18710.1 TrkA family potassium uptake protein [Limnochorda sp. L945t]
MAMRRRRTRQFAVIGLGRFGSSVASTLYKQGQEVLAIDNVEDRVQEMAPHVTHAVQADATDEQAMRAIGIRNFDVVIVAIGEIEASILATSVVKGLGVRYVVAKALSDLHGRVLERVGADRVVYPERDMGVRVAHNLLSGNIIDYIELMPGYSIVEVTAKEGFIGRTLRELDFRAKYGITVLAIRRGTEVIVAPNPDTTIEKEDVLVAMGEDERLEELEALP